MYRKAIKSTCFNINSNTQPLHDGEGRTEGQLNLTAYQRIQDYFCQTVGGKRSLYGRIYNFMKLFLSNFLSRLCDI